MEHPPPPRIAVLDLTLGGRRCAAPSEMAGAWIWEPAERDFSAFPGDAAFAEAWDRTPEWVPATDDASRPAIVRVWAASEDSGPCPVKTAEAMGMLDEAAGVARRRLGGSAEVLPDPAQLLLSAPRPTSEPQLGYAGGVLVR